MVSECLNPSCDRGHYAPGPVRVFLLWIGGERVRCPLCPSCAAAWLWGATDVRVLEAV